LLQPYALGEMAMEQTWLLSTAQSLWSQRYCIHAGMYGLLTFSRGIDAKTGDTAIRMLFP